MMEGGSGILSGGAPGGASPVPSFLPLAGGDGSPEGRAEGWLLKKGRIHKNWKRRWMVLRGAQLFYFTQPHLKDSAAKGVVNLEGAEISRPDDAASDPALATSGNVLFLIKTAKGRIYMLKGEQDKDVELWVPRLQRATKLKSPAATDNRTPSPPGSPKSVSMIVGASQASSGATRKGHAKTEKKGVNLYKRYLTGADKQRGRVFGISLEVLVRREATDPGIPIVIQRIIAYLDQVPECQGIFRLSGGAEQVRNLKKAFDTAKDQWTVALPEDLLGGPHAVASLLKLFMKELPEPLVPDEFYKPFLMVQKYRWQDATPRLRALRELIFKMPTAHRLTLAAIADLLRRIAKNSQVNQMTPKNLAICLAPNVFRSNDLNLLESMTDAPYLLSIMKTFITQHAYLFAGEENITLIGPDRKSGVPVLIPLQQEAARENSPPAVVAPCVTITDPPSERFVGAVNQSGDSLVLEIESFLYDQEILDEPTSPRLDHQELLAAVQMFISECVG